ncbi:MAG: Mandelate racemase/muconate lactonizing protein [Microbacteriaceae bacterium]|nr:Mandelate racemase/muconate lactonizing protein [Microbacteriaceae bacterium]
MRITAVETFHVEPRWLIVKMTTDAGIVGYGEPVVEGRARTVETTVREMSEYLIGKDPRRIEHHWQAIYRGGFYRGGPILTSALSGLEQAMWDIKGKALGVPVYELLGGHVRDSVRMYAHCHGDTPEALAATAHKRMADGFRAVKLAVDGPAWPIETPQWVDDQVARVALVRDIVGSSVNIAVDFHGRVGPAVANTLISELAYLRLMFVEEPCLPDNASAMADIAARSSIPIATGERLFTRWQYRELLESKAVAVVQPDLCHVGGIFEARKIAAMAETYYVSVAPHNPLGPISLAACLQLDACTPNFLIQEHPTLEDGSDLGNGILVEPFEIVGGSIAIPTGPGLGIEIDEDALARIKTNGDWESPRFWHEDGSVAEW